MSDIPTKYYRKELFSTPFFLNRGVKAPFEPVGGDNGVLATSDPSLIFSLENAVSRRVGGIIPITLAEYDELKKKETPISKSSARSQPQIRAVPQASVGPVVSAYLPQQRKSPAAEDAPPTPEPRSVPPAIEAGKAKRTVRTGKPPPQV